MSISKRPGSPYWWVEFVYRGERIRFSTKQTNAVEARKQEAAKRIELGNGDAGIRPKTAAPSLKSFLADRFLPFVETKHAEKPNTITYYKRGAGYLTAATFSNLRVDEITTEHVQQFVGEHAKLSASSINCGLRTLRHILRLAVEWGVTEKALRVPLAKGERKRERVLSQTEIDKYLAACSGVWRIVATILLGTGMRPGEVFGLRWENVSLIHGVIDIREGKTSNAKRRLPMLQTLLDTITSHWEALGRPASGWVFPSPHGNGNAQAMPYTAHREAIQASGVAAFVPYTMRHTALTMLGAAGVDPFTIMRIAGHSTIAVTQRYIHPQEETVRAAFDRLETPTVPTKSPTPIRKAS